ncbi:AAA family ATPase [Sinorhizobium meliloti]|uniref:AAA family ATPase n=2 Tax=Sinorhizobium/Ensifer group TaxID=227292 RepID=UPI000FDA47B4|nr:AAA family ATPase [Sinorhizobium meliloti]RVH16516.1 OLD family endonuclease [Sinorhizobium meliloti]RVH53149.1 OLD family endonuclease [Sinorhizobium meliloti]
MKLKSARIQNYRSIKDTGVIEFERDKTILVGPNEAGKSAILQALQQLKPPKGVRSLDALRDYPRSLYNDITKGKVDPATTPVVTAVFTLEDEDRDALPESLQDKITEYRLTRNLDNRAVHTTDLEKTGTSLAEIQKDLDKIAAHVDSNLSKQEEVETTKTADELAKLVQGINPKFWLTEENRGKVRAWLKKLINEITDPAFEEKYDDVLAKLDYVDEVNAALKTLHERTPVFVLSNNYFRVRPRIHLAHLHERQANKTLDDDKYDYGNLCLLKLLGFTAQELANAGTVTDEQRRDRTDATIEAIERRTDERQYQLDAASARLTDEIRSIWNPDPKKAEADKLRVLADGLYLKVVVEDDLGVSVELDQRSEGFQWLVSFFVVFFAEAEDNYENAILLLDEPGVSLHALKQREFQRTISRLAENNQTIFTTHSPFLVGSGELDLVRVVEMTDRKIGTKVHTTVTSNDPAGLLPLQEALGYDLAQSLFTKRKNFILEGLTDYWYVEAVSSMLEAAGKTHLDKKIALVPSGTASKVAYFATILHANNLKVAALLDSDRAGDTVASHDVLVHTLKQKALLRTDDFLIEKVKTSEIEDLLRETLVGVAKAELEWDIAASAAKHTDKPIVDIFTLEVPGFSKYKLAKAFLRWSRDRSVDDLTANEIMQFENLFEAVNKVLT